MGEILKIILNCIFTTIVAGLSVTLTAGMLAQDEKISLFYLFLGGIIGAVVAWNVFNIIIKNIEKFLMKKQ